MEKMFLRFAPLIIFLFSFSTVNGNPSAPVIVKKDTLFLVYENDSRITAAERATVINIRLNEIIEDPEFEDRFISIKEDSLASGIFYKQKLLMTVDDSDAKINRKSREVLTDDYKKMIVTALVKHNSSTSLKKLFIEIGLLAAVLLILGLLIFYINRLLQFTIKKLVRFSSTRLKNLEKSGLSIASGSIVLRYITSLTKIVRVLIIVILVYLSLPFIFSILPWTKEIADELFGYILNPVKDILMSVLRYVPNLLSILVIYFVTRYVVRLVRYLAKELEKGKIKINGFYADWAMPTYNIVRTFLYVFMFVVIFPYLPGSESKVFQGVSVFLGLVISLGSSSAISNIIAGIVITYMRPFKMGDRVKIGDVYGDVIEKTLLVTRVRTIKNEDITVPNSTVLTNYSINYSSLAKEQGLILHTTVTIGYDAPWRQVHELLISAAKATEGILGTTEPFVLQTSLDDFYVSYQINAYTDAPQQIESIYSSLHNNIQDKFNEAGVEIMSPHYNSLRDGNQTTIPETYLAKDYKAPKFGVSKE